ncbi:MAG: SxtJ family membrane protein [Ignavibacteriales bacterium]|nr:SxtJ family membrane protein [Ignavibacteriales bacterium]
MIIEEIKNIKSTKKDLRSFGLTIGIALIIIGLIIFLLKGNISKLWFGGGLIIILVGLTFPILLLPLQKFWMAFSVILGWVSTRIILSLIFYFVLTPTRFLAKLFGKNFLILKFKTEEKSYWQKRVKKEFNPSDYERQF